MSFDFRTPLCILVVAALSIALPFLEQRVSPEKTEKKQATKIASSRPNPPVSGTALLLAQFYPAQKHGPQYGLFGDPNKIAWISYQPSKARYVPPVQGGSSANFSCEGAGSPGVWLGRVPSIARCIEERYGHLIDQASKQTGVDARLIKAVMISESEGNPLAVSSDKCCLGLMQLNVSTTAEEFGVSPERVFEPSENIAGGARALASYIRRAGTLEQGLSWYRYGPAGTLRKSQSEGLDPIRNGYVDKVKQVYALI